MKKIGVVGTGKTVGIADDHLNGIQANKKEWILEAIYDLNIENAQEFVERNELNQNIICSTLDDLFSKVDAIAICTNNSSHREIAEYAINRSIPVICEKPLSDTYKEAEMLALKANESNIPNYMGMQYRYHGYAQVIKEILNSKKLGEITFYRHNLGGSRLGNSNIELEWRMKKETSGLGSIADFGIHQLDLIDFFLNDIAGDISEITAQTGTYIKNRTSPAWADDGKVTNDDVGILYGKLENGALFNLCNSRIFPSDGHCLEIIGLKAAIYMDNNHNIFIREKDKDGNWNNYREQKREEDKHSFLGGARGKQYKEFYDIINNDVSYELNFKYGAEKLGLIEKAVKNFNHCI